MENTYLKEKQNTLSELQALAVLIHTASSNKLGEMIWKD